MWWPLPIIPVLRILSYMRPFKKNKARSWSTLERVFFENFIGSLIHLLSLDLETWWCHWTFSLQCSLNPGYSPTHGVLHSDLSHIILFFVHLLVSSVVPSRQSRWKLNCSSSYIPPYCPVQHCLSAWFSSMVFMIPFGLWELNTPQGLTFAAVIFLNAFKGLKSR